MIDFLKVFTKLGVKNPDKWAKSCINNLPKFGIIDNEDQCRFLANTMNESGKFTKFVESLKYTTEVRLCEVFPSAFGKVITDPKLFRSDLKTITHPTKGIKIQLENGKYNRLEYLNQEQKLANLVYNDNYFPNKKLNNFGPNDGWLYRGRGSIQCTGKNVYKMISDKSGIDFISNPDLLGTEDYAILGACIYWQNGGLSKCKSLLETRQKVAGNYTNKPFGIEEVTNYYNQIKGAL